MIAAAPVATVTPPARAGRAAAGRWQPARVGPACDSDRMAAAATTVTVTVTAVQARRLLGGLRPDPRAGPGGRLGLRPPLLARDILLAASLSESTAVIGFDRRRRASEPGCH